MTSSNIPTTNIADRIASGDYWKDPAPDPTLGMDSDARELYLTAIRDATGDMDSAEEIGVLAMSLSGGGSFENLPEGSELPELPEDSRQAIRLVEDSLVVVRRGSKHHRGLKSLQAAIDKQQEDGIHPGFDVLAEQAMDPRYMHVFPAYDLRSAGLRKVMSVSRTIHYMRPIFEGKLGLCVGSVFAQTPEDLKRVKPDVIPMVPVGTTYVRGNRVSKIARADVVEATGIMWRGGDAPKKPNQRNKHFAAGLLPRLAPGLGS